MNRFEDAARDLLATVPTPTTVETLRTRVRRHRRRRATAIVAVIGVVSLASIGAAASLGHKTSGPRIAVAPTTTRTSAWCVSTSRATAIADVAQFTRMVAKGDTEHAKLMTWKELLAKESASTRSLIEPSANDQTEVWVVEVLGTVTELFGSGPTKYSWGLFEIDANGHGVLQISAGPGTTPSYWDALPDHSADCPSDNTRPAQPFKPPAPPQDECSPGQSQTFTAWDHGTSRPVQVNRTYWCRRRAELQPPADTHLSGSIAITNGKVTAQYYRVTDHLHPSPDPRANGAQIDTAVTSTTPVPFDQLPPSIQKALKEP